MTRDEALARAARNEPIGELREVVFALRELQNARTSAGTPAWYLLNRLQRVAMEAADFEERGLVQCSTCGRRVCGYKRADGALLPRPHVALTVVPDGTGRSRSHRKCPEGRKAKR